MSEQICEYHTQLATDIGIIKKSLEYIESKVCKHVEEGEKVGGWRDRLIILEKEVSELKKRFWSASILGGLIGALIGAGSGDIISLFIKWVMNIK